jgi:hypothetical protein
MKNSKWKFGILAAMALAATTTFMSQARADPVSFVYAPATITNPGDPVGVDIFVAGLSGALGGFAFQLDYNGAQLTFVSFAANPDDNMGPGFWDMSLGDLGITVDFFTIADGTITEAALYAAQGSGGSFRIGHVDFTGVAAGPFTLTLSNVTLSDFYGETICSGAACVGTAPEPGTALLVAIALGAMALRRRRQLVA